MSLNIILLLLLFNWATIFFPADCDTFEKKYFVSKIET